MDQIARIFEKENYPKHVGPQLYVIDSANVGSFDWDTSLVPNGFKPTHTIN